MCVCTRAAGPQRVLAQRVLRAVRAAGGRDARLLAGRVRPATVVVHLRRDAADVGGRRRRAGTCRDRRRVEWRDGRRAATGDRWREQREQLARLTGSRRPAFSDAPAANAATAAAAAATAGTGTVTTARERVNYLTTFDCFLTKYSRRTSTVVVSVAEC